MPAQQASPMVGEQENPSERTISMKVLSRIACIMACVLIGSCSKHDKAETTDTDQAPVAPPPPAATPEPVKAVVAATPAPKRLAPDGMFFLVVKKSVETSDGISGLAPGTQVLRQADGKYVADGHTLALQPSEITNDLDVAARYAGADARAQAAIKQTLQAHATAPKPGAPGLAANASGAGTSAPVASSASASGLVPATQRSNGTLLDGSSALGSAHSKIQGGWLYEKDAQGNWMQVRQVR
jgi:hypothetical protein